MIKKPWKRINDSKQFLLISICFLLVALSSQCEKHIILLLKLTSRNISDFHIHKLFTEYYFK